MTRSVFSYQHLPISEARARELLGEKAVDMTDEDIRLMISRVTIAAEVISSVIDGRPSITKDDA